MSTKDKKKSKVPLSERLLQRRGRLNKKGTGAMLYFKEGKTRIRVLNAGQDNDWAVEVDYFYLSQELGGFVSPATFGEPCPLFEAYKELSKSKKESDRTFAEMLKPKKKWIVPVYRYNDDKGLEPDLERGICLALLSNIVYGGMIDYFTDSEHGDFTDPINGYDLKVIRVGKGKNDTEYTVSNCKPTKAAKRFREEIDPEELVKKACKTYEELEEVLEKFIHIAPAGEDDDDEPKKKKSSSKDRDREKKKKRSKDY